MTPTQGLYDGRGLVERAAQVSGGADGLIVVSINYRLGVFGFMSGTTTEAHSLPNAGLHDQRAALAWGESGGGGAIVSHLVAWGGTVDPLFRKAVIQSPGSWPVVDRRGKPEAQFETFAALAGCNQSSTVATAEAQRMRCLRKADVSVLKEANVKIFPGTTPTPDGQFLRQNPMLEFAKGNYWKDMESIIISHVIDEGGPFVPDPVPESFVNDTLAGVFPAYAADQAKMLQDLYMRRYPVDVRARAAAVMRDATFAGNIRGVVEAYPDITWAMQYSGQPRIHGSDIPATWWRRGLYNQTRMPVWEAFQARLVRQAMTGDPNAKEEGAGDLHWPRVGTVGGEYSGNMLNVMDNGFNVMREDMQTSKSVFAAWREAVWETTRRGGYEMP